MYAPIEEQCISLKLNFVTELLVSFLICITGDHLPELMHHVLVFGGSSELGNLLIEEYGPTVSLLLGDDLVFLTTRH